MRPIEFRGKIKDNGEWTFGFYTEDEDLNSFILFDEFIEVDPDTVGQYIGLPDKNGRKVFEDDILDFGNGIRAVVCWKEDGARFETNPPVEMYEDGYAEFCVCGNIHDTPELLGGGA